MFSPQKFEKWDFTIVKEDWSRYRVSDGAMLRLRVAVTDIIRSEQLDLTGYPSYQYFATNLVSIIVPKKLLGTPSSAPPDPRVEKPDEIDFEDIEIKEQEYHTSDGFKILLKPVLQKVFKYNKYSQLGDPIYQITAQSTSNIKKIIQKPVEGKIE